MKRNVECECGTFEVEGDSFEDIRDAIAEHLMLTHQATEWQEHNLPEGYNGDSAS